MTGPPIAPDDFAQWKVEQDFAQWKAAQSTPSPTQARVRAALKLPGGKERLERNVQRQFEDELPSVGDYIKDQASGLAAGLTSISKDIPGAEAAQAGVRSVVRGQPYREALSDIQGAEDELSPVARIPLRLAGSGMTAAAMPGGTAATVGGRMGVLSGLLQSDPDKNLGQRVTSGAVQGLVGAGAGKLGSLIGTSMRGKVAPAIDESVVGLDTERRLAADPAYKAFRDAGDLGSTPKLDKILNLKIVRNAVDAVKGEDPVLADLPDTHAEVLDQAYKVIGNKAWRAANGFTKANARDALGDAIEEAAQGKGVSYASALKAYREPSQVIEGVNLGRDVLRNAARPSGTAAGKILTSSPAAFKRDVGSLPPLTRQGAIEGITGELGDSPNWKRIFKVPVAPTKKLLKAEPLLDAAGSPTGQGGTRSLLAILNSLSNR